MRVWDVDPKLLCRQHLLGEHQELHGLWNILAKHGGQGGYSQHPETRRWVGKLRALYARHQALVEEMERRGYTHGSDLDPDLASGSAVQDAYVPGGSPDEQLQILREKPCPCLR